MTSGAALLRAKTATLSTSLQRSQTQALWLGALQCGAALYGCAAKRGGGWRRLTLDDAVTLHDNRTLDFLALDDALTKLGQLSERQCRVVELRFFCGLTIAEAAEALGLGSTTVEDDWHVAKAWLAIELSGGTLS